MAYGNNLVIVGVCKSVICTLSNICVRTSLRKQSTGFRKTAVADFDKVLHMLLIINLGL